MEPELFSQDKLVDNGTYSAHASTKCAPLAVRMRPTQLSQFVGQAHILGQGKLLRRIILADRLQSAIFFGPSGCGKTTLGHIIAQVTRSHYDHINAVTSNSQQLRKLIDQAKERKKATPEKKTIVFIDEFHRFNRAQQDILMQEVEQGGIILLGATTHNPSFAINGPLLSRALIFELTALTEEDIITVIKNAINDTERGLGGMAIQYEDAALHHIAKQSCGDARRALNALEVGILTTDQNADGIISFTRAIAEESVQRKIVYYDRDDDYHYDTISAFIKSMRGSDPDASLYWLAKMIYAGEDPRFIARRIIILASEDIGNADPHALNVATSALNALEFVGMPEGRIILAQAVTYMATAPKSNASYSAFEKALEDVKEGVVEDVPSHLRDKSYASAKRLQRGEGYKYPHNYSDAYVDQNYKCSAKVYYNPSDRGYEKIIKQRLALLKNNKKKGGGSHDF